MTETADKLLTFEEFATLNGEGRYELVNGRLEELVAPTPRHGWTQGRINSSLDGFLSRREPDAYWGVELDIPTIPFFGRRPDVAYFSTQDAARIDFDKDTVLGVPTLVIEVLSAEDETRDLVTKREEYARAGIAHYWILDPRRRTATLLALREGAYEVVREFSGNQTLTSDLFPGLKIPFRQLFR